jgi:DNA polymerase IV
MIACVRIPYFAISIEARGNPRFSTLSVIMVRYTPKGRGKVIAYSASAEAVGVDVGMLSVRAAALCPEAAILPMTPTRYRRALQGIMSRLTVFSQWIDADKDYFQTAYLYLDLGKLRPSDGRTLAAQIVQRLCEQEGIAASVGLAADKFTAQVAACLATIGQAQLVARGEEPSFLSPLPVTFLRADTEAARRLALFGLRTIGQAAAIPRGSMVAQFGEQGSQLHRWAAGEDNRRVTKFLEPQTERAEMTFDDPVEDRLIVQNALYNLANELAERLAKSSFTCREIALTAYMERGRQIEDHRQLKQPIHTFAALYRALQAALERMTFHCRVERIEVELGKLKPVLPKQLSLFDSATKPPVIDIMREIAARYDERLYTAGLDTRHAYASELAFYLESLEPA